MGCDIHMVLEVKHNDKWIGFDGKCRNARDRNYNLFTELAGVRGRSATSLERRGVPEDASDLALMMVDNDGSDGHSHSWVTMQEYADAVNRAKDAYEIAADVARRLEGNTAGEDVVYSRFGLWDDERHRYRIVFWFDN